MKMTASHPVTTNRDSGMDRRDRISLLTLALSAVLFYAPGAAAQALNAETTCNLVQMPATAVRVTAPPAEPVFHYPDPRIVPADYSGCLNTWLDGNIRAMQARFEQGKVVWFRVGNNDVFCEYESDRVVKQVVAESLRRQVAESGMIVTYCPPGQELSPPRWR